MDSYIEHMSNSVLLMCQRFQTLSVRPLQIHYIVSHNHITEYNCFNESNPDIYTVRLYIGRSYVSGANGSWLIHNIKVRCAGVYVKL